MTDAQEQPAGAEPERDPGPDGSAGPSAVRKVLTALTVVGALAMLVSLAFWIGEACGWPTSFPYVLLGVGGLILYNLARLPFYFRYF